MKTPAYRVEVTKSYRMDECGVYYTLGPVEDYRDRYTEQTVYPVTAVIPNDSEIVVCNDETRRIFRPEKPPMTLQEAIDGRYARILRGAGNDTH